MEAPDLNKIPEVIEIQLPHGSMKLFPGTEAIDKKDDKGNIIKNSKGYPDKDYIKSLKAKGRINLSGGTKNYGFLQFSYLDIKTIINEYHGNDEIKQLVDYYADIENIENLKLLKNGGMTKTQILENAKIMNLDEELVKEIVFGEGL